jgi:hypothetical protein
VRLISLASTNEVRERLAIFMKAAHFVPPLGGGGPLIYYIFLELDAFGAQPIKKNGAAQATLIMYRAAQSLGALAQKLIKLAYGTRNEACLS